MTLSIKISSKDLTRAPETLKLPERHLELVAALSHSLMQIIDYHCSTPSNGSLKDAIGVAGERWYAGALVLAVSAADSLERLVDWERWGENGGGVFTYENVELFNPQDPQEEDNTVTRFLFNLLTLPAWADICENCKTVSQPVMDMAISHWMKRENIPQKDQTEPAVQLDQPGQPYPPALPGQLDQKRMEFTTGRFYGPKPQTILAWQAGNNWRFYDAAREVAGEFPGLLPNSRAVLTRYDQGGYSALFLSRGELERARAADVQICCKTCGGQNVKRDAWASWDPDIQEWVLEQVFDAGHCDDCGGETSLTTEPLPTAYEVWLPALPGPVTVRATLEELAEVRACVGAKVWGDINTMNLYDLQSSL